MEQEEKLCDEVETVGEFTYIGDRLNACGGCEAAVTAITRCGWVKFRECIELLYGRGVYESYIRPAILYGGEVIIIIIIMVIFKCYFSGELIALT